MTPGGWKRNTGVWRGATWLTRYIGPMLALYRGTFANAGPTLRRRWVTVSCWLQHDTSCNETLCSSPVIRQIILSSEPAGYYFTMLTTWPFFCDSQPERAPETMETWGCSDLKVNMEPWPNAGLMLGQRRRRWPNIKTALDRCPVLTWHSGSDAHQRQALVHCWKIQHA